MKKPVMLFLSATPFILERFLGNSLEIVYNEAPCYDYIEKIYCYNKQKTANNIIQSIPRDEKILFFANNKKRLKELASQDRNSVYFSADILGTRYYNDLEMEWDDLDSINLCEEQEQNNVFDADRTRTAYENIIKYSKFNTHAIFTTSVLDNGINIIDESVKHVFIEMIDFIDFIQCLGRKRTIDENDKINLYIFNFNNNKISNSLSKINKELQEAEQARNNRTDYLRQHRREQLPNIMDNFGYTILVVKERYEYYKEIYKSIQSRERTFLDIIADFLKKDVNSFIKYEDILDKDSLINKVINQYKDLKMYKEEQNEFKSMIHENVIQVVNSNRSSMGYRVINARFQELNIPYMINSYKCTSRKDENYGKRYWKIEEHKWDEEH